MANLSIALFLFLFSPLILSPAAAFDGKVGGRMEINDVRSNKEVQELGRFSIHEFNRLIVGRRGNSGEELRFSKVVAAERQVVSGVKYFLRIEAENRAGEKRCFESVVVVKPWLRSKELVKFEPASAVELRRLMK